MPNKKQTTELDLTRRIDVLKFKWALLQKVIRDAQAEGDPRWQGHPVAQQRAIGKRLAEAKAELRKLRGEPEPEDVVVKVKTLDMESRTLPVQETTKPTAIKATRVRFVAKKENEDNG